MAGPQILEGVSNFRDIGGYAAADGRTVKHGVVYRSNQLSRVTDADLDHLVGLKLSAICDLRSVRERKAQPTPDRIGAAIHGSAKPDTDFIFEDIFAHTPHEVDAWVDAFARFYGDVTEYYADEFGLMFRLILGSDLPMVVHCSAGKDRTGVATALVLTALGVPYATVKQDFLLSNGAPGMNTLLPSLGQGGVSSEIMAPVIGVEPAYLDTAFATIRKDYGSVDAYLAKELGVGPRERAALRRRMLR